MQEGTFGVFLVLNSNSLYHLWWYQVEGMGADYSIKFWKCKDSVALLPWLHVTSNIECILARPLGKNPAMTLIPFKLLKLWNKQVFILLCHK